MRAIADKSGYIAWNGGARPIAKDARVHVQMRSCALKSGFACDFYWKHHNVPDDILAYAIIPKKSGDETWCIYDHVNAKPKRLSLSQQNQKKINLYLLQQLESKNKAFRKMEERLSRLEAERAGE